jgi:hypothetical protein
MPKTIVISKKLGDDVGLGGPGSGHWGHKGRPGQRGGSVPRGGSGPSYQVGITSSLDGRPEAQVAGEMGEFKSAMEKTSVTNLSVELGRGGWAGGSEPTFVTQYDGNGEGLRAIAGFAKKYEQQAVLVQRYTSKRSEDAQPQSRWTFNKKLDPEQVSAIEEALADVGFGGWTWTKRGNGTMLMVTCVPPWGGTAEGHSTSAQALSDALAYLGFTAQEHTRYVIVTVMEQGDYDAYLEG